MILISRLFESIYLFPPYLELVRGKIDSFLLYDRASCDPVLTLSLAECSALLGVERVWGKMILFHFMLESTMILLWYCLYSKVEVMCNEYANSVRKTILKRFWLVDFLRGITSLVILIQIKIYTLDSFLLYDRAFSNSFLTVSFSESRGFV